MIVKQKIPSRKSFRSFESAGEFKWYAFLVTYRGFFLNSHIRGCIYDFKSSGVDYIQVYVDLPSDGKSRA